MEVYWTSLSRTVDISGQQDTVYGKSYSSFQMKGGVALKNTRSIGIIFSLPRNTTLLFLSNFFSPTSGSSSCKKLWIPATAVLRKPYPLSIPLLVLLFSLFLSFPLPSLVCYPTCNLPPPHTLPSMFIVFIIFSPQYVPYYLGLRFMFQHGKIGSFHVMLLQDNYICLLCNDTLQLFLFTLRPLEEVLMA